MPKTWVNNTRPENQILVDGGLVKSIISEWNALGTTIRIESKSSDNSAYGGAAP